MEARSFCQPGKACTQHTRGFCTACIKGTAPAQPISRTGQRCGQEEGRTGTRHQAPSSPLAAHSEQHRQANDSGPVSTHEVLHTVSCVVRSTAQHRSAQFKCCAPVSTHVVLHTVSSVVRSTAQAQDRPAQTYRSNL